MEMIDTDIEINEGESVVVTIHGQPVTIGFNGEAYYAIWEGQEIGYGEILENVMLDVAAELNTAATVAEQIVLDIR